ncbi:MAG: hypothetical protein JNN03_21620 [Rubrivivax sp.]|nr:hypothetical protein [Rubrivivax sp.]
MVSLAPVAAQANQGLVASAGEWLWPQFQARITVQTAAIGPVMLTRLFEPGAPGMRGVQGGSLLGDYVFATPGFGNFRATSGVMLGGPGGAPVLTASPLTRVGVTVLDGGSTGGNSTADTPLTLPYLGLGYSSASLWRSLSVSADVGLVAGRPAGLSGLGRAMLGSQAMDAAVRDLRLAPVLQLGVRYSF